MPPEKLRPSFSFTADRLRDLQQAVPEAFADGKIDWDALREALGEHLEDEAQEHFGLTWPGKREARRLAALPPQGTLAPAPGEGVDEETAPHLFIEADNLEALKLLQKSYAGRIKMIYIDPPYNTGNDFIYEDDYAEPLEAYLKRTGQIDEAGRKLTTNTRASGRFHSRWLSMMYPRLLLARQLLRDDGVIFVSIDDNEVHHLRMVMNEVFGEECFKNTIVVRRGIKSVQAQFDTIDRLTVGHEYMVFYAKNAEARFKHFLIDLDESRSGGWNNHWRGTNRPTMRYELLGITPTTGQWRWGKERSLEAIKNYEQMTRELGYSPVDEIPQDEIDQWYLEKLQKTGEDLDLLRLSKNNKPEHYVPPSETKMGSDLWIDLSPRDNQLSYLLGTKAFDNPKPLEWLQRLIAFITSENDIILDFFAGSCTTAHAVLAQNREDG
ncbi:MAG: site-specific DNA-methyltransferase, partial [Anaerolineales bacterium]|nr:site-specific DNA-methyltransferase [Anaerolineales bacterium]